MQEIAEQAVATGAGAVGGGALVLWWAKLLMRRMVEQYDQAHKTHEQRIEKLVERFGNFREQVMAKLSAIEVRTAEIVSIRDAQIKATGDVAVLKAEATKLRTDINVAHERIRASGISKR